MKSVNHDHVDRLVEQYFGSRNGQLMVGDVALHELAATYGTPLYVYSGEALDRKWDALRTALPDRIEVYYSMKANPTQAVLRYFIERGCGLEVASAGELQQALTAGCAADRILFAGPGKTDSELAQAVVWGIGEIHLESIAEARRLSRIAGQLKRTVPVALRINPAADASGGAMRMGGKAAPFGIDEEHFEEAVDTISMLAHLKITGIHLFSGTQILDAQILVTQYRKAIELGSRLAKRTGEPPRTIDFGGGWGIPYFPHETALDLDAMREHLELLMSEVDGQPALAEARLIIEPGRFLVGEAGLYVTRVIEVKKSRGKTFVITDGGMHHHLAASGNLGQTIKRNYPVALADKLDQPSGESVDIVGPLCTPLDVLGRNVKLPAAEPGDLVTVFQSGAYGRSASPLHFLSHATPPEVWVDSGRHWQVRRRQEDSCFADQVQDLSAPNDLAAANSTCAFEN